MIIGKRAQESAIEGAGCKAYNETYLQRRRNARGKFFGGKELTMTHFDRLVKIEDYEPYVGAEAIERMQKKARKLKDLHVVNVNSTYYGGGVAELLSSMTLLMNSVGIKTGWRVIQGAPDFFSITKKMHNALQGDEINLSDRKIQLYEEVIYENAVRNHLENHNMVIIHDPQPLPMIKHYKKNGPWIWRCHIDLTSPNKELWNYLAPTIEKYDAVIFSLKEYTQNIKTPQVFFMPAIDPFKIKNQEMNEEEIRERLEHYGIPDDLPLVVQVSRFDRWKDPQGVIEAFKRARKEVDCTLVLLGNVATDDPEGAEIYESLLKSREERVIILSHQDTALVNALQRKAAVVLQKSIREGFGLTVTEAMWKGAPVIGGNVGGIRYQIEDGVNGFLVSSVEETAERIVQLIKDERLRRQLGKKAKETVTKRFLLTRYLEQYLDLFNSFETIYRLIHLPKDGG
jgi:trehalose synthase